MARTSEQALEHNRLYMRARYAADPGPTKERSKQWRANNPKRAKEQQQEFKARRPHYRQDYLAASEHNRIVNRLRSSLYGALRKRKRPAADWIANAKIGQLVGCSKPDLIAHIEAQFKRGMGWHNYGRGGWEIDHIRQCNTFDLTDAEQQALCFNFTNLRPLWRADNLSRPKGSA